MQAKTYKALSVLLLYPSKDIISASDNILSIIKKERLISLKNIANIKPTIESFKIALKLSENLLS